MFDTEVRVKKLSAWCEPTLHTLPRQCTSLQLLLAPLQTSLLMDYDL